MDSRCMSRRQAKAFVQKMIRHLGLGFHPDTPVSEYVETRTGRPTYSKDDATRLQRGMDCAFMVLGVPGIHDFAWKTARPLVQKMDGSRR